MAKIKGIRQRWMLNSISAVVLITLVAVSAFSIAMASYYYSSMSTGLQSKATAAAGFFRNTVESEFRPAATRYVESFEKASPQGRMRKYYRITKKGRGLLEEKEKEWNFSP